MALEIDMLADQAMIREYRLYPMSYSFVMKQYLAVCSIAVIVFVKIGTTTTMTYLASYAVEKPSKPSRALPALIAASDENVYVV